MIIYKILIWKRINTSNLQYIHQADFVVKVLIHLRLNLRQWDEEKGMEARLKVSKQTNIP